MSPPKVALSTSTVTVVVDPDKRSGRRRGRRSATRRRSSGLGVTAWSIIALVFLTSGLAIFDLYLLLTGLQ
jgi:hypothetical protein